MVAWLLLACSWQRLSSSISARPYHSVLTGLLLYALIDQANFAGEWLIGGVEAKCFAYACIFTALANIVDGHWRRAWPWFGLGGSFHVLVGGWATITAAGVWLLQPRTDRPTLKSMLPSLLLGGCMALPGLIPAWQLMSQVPPEVKAEAGRIYVFDRLAHHLAPLTMPFDDLLVRAGPFAMLVLIMAGFWMWLCRLDYKTAAPSSPNTMHRLKLLMQFTLLTLATTSCGLVWEVATWNYPLISARVLRYYLFRLSDIMVPVATSLMVVVLIQELMASRSRWATALLLLAVFWPGWLLVKETSYRWYDSCPPADRKMEDHLSWKEACLWARKNTPHESLFLVPRQSHSFQWFAHRPDVVTRKNVPQDAESLLSWSKRYQDVFTYRDELGERATYRSLAHQGAIRLKELADKHGADYVITREYPPLQLPVRYANEHYTIYALSAATDQSRQAEEQP